jgi:hypothetical protein
MDISPSSLRQDAHQHIDQFDAHKGSNQTAQPIDQ